MKQVLVITFVIVAIACDVLSFTFNSKSNIRLVKSKNIRMMFSGIVEDMGVVDSINFNKAMPMWDGSIGEGVELTISSTVAVEDAYIGCSIAVNGVCLTATQYDSQKFTVGLAPETLRRTNLGSLTTGSKVNLERALRADGRNSGHFVQGHVDGTGSIIDRWVEGDSLWMKVQVSSDIIKYIVPKGFICIDGTSLTVCEVSYPNNKDNKNNGWFTIMLVSHTQQNVIFPTKFKDDTVNIEVDVLGKMVEKSLVSNLASIRSDLENKDKEILELKTLLAEQQLIINNIQQQLKISKFN